MNKQTAKSVSSSVGYGFNLGTDTSFGISHEVSDSQGEGMEVSFTLCDPDLGDEFVTEIGSDPLYGTPVFSTVLGKTSCNWEFDHSIVTAPREKFSIGIYPGVRTCKPPPEKFGLPDPSVAPWECTQTVRDLNEDGSNNPARQLLAERCDILELTVGKDLLRPFDRAPL